MVRIGLISDTHGLVRPEAKAFLKGSDLIIHAGDICDASVLVELNTIAPITAVRGNNDRGVWAEELHESEYVQIDQFRIYIIHDLSRLDVDPQAAEVHAIISGHSHKPRVEERDGVLFVNPGSAGPRRFTLPISIGEMIIDGTSLSAKTVELQIRKVA